MKKLTDITGQKACYSFFGENKLLDEQEKLYMQREYQAFCDWKNEVYSKVKANDRCYIFTKREF